MSFMYGLHLMYCYKPAGVQTYAHTPMKCRLNIINLHISNMYLVRLLHYLLTQYFRIEKLLFGIN